MLNENDEYLYLFQQKKLENEEALKHLQNRLTTLDKLDGTEKIKALILGVLAGNIFDWGAKEVAVLMETQNFSFEDAQSKIPSNYLLLFVPAFKCSTRSKVIRNVDFSDRPWLADCLDDWVARLEREPPPKCAAVFVDNSGVDIVLGILPFVRDLLQRGTKVKFCLYLYSMAKQIQRDERKINFF